MISYEVRCDICGEAVAVPLIKTDDPNDQSVYQPEDIVPKEWAVLVIKHRTDEADRKYRGHLCPYCAKAIESGEGLEIYRQRHWEGRDRPEDYLIPVDHIDPPEENPDGEICEEVSEEEAVHITTEGTQ